MYSWGMVQDWEEEPVCCPKPGDTPSPAPCVASNRLWVTWLPHLGPGWGEGAFLGLDCLLLPCVTLSRAEHNTGTRGPESGCVVPLP